MLAVPAPIHTWCWLYVTMWNVECYYKSTFFFAEHNSEKKYSPFTKIKI